MHSPNSDEQRADTHAPIEPLRLKYGPKPLQFGDLYLPDSPGPYPTVILIHAGHWRAHYALHLMNGLAEDLAKRAYPARNIEYRRAGDPGGAWPRTFPDAPLSTAHLTKP